MGLEKEVKLRIEHRMFLKLIGKLGLKPRFKKKVAQEDEFFDYEDMRLVKRDSVLRIRKENDRLLVTYKGPRKIINGVKIREEIEGPVGSKRCLEALKAAGISADRVSSIGDLYKLLSSAGLSKKAEVRKERKIYRLDGFDCEVCLDSVSELGEFVEMEGESAEMLLKKMGIDDRIVRKSYLELLFEKRLDAGSFEEIK